MLHSPLPSSDTSSLKLSETKGWQSRAWKESHSQELDDVRVAEGAHHFTLFHKLGEVLSDFTGRKSRSGPGIILSRGSF